MKHLRRAAVLVVGSFLATPASAATYYVWQGEAVVTAATAVCSAGSNERVKIGVGSVLKSIVRPKLVPGSSNGNDSRIAFLHDAQSEMALALAAGLAFAGNNGSYAAYGVTPRGQFKTNVGGTYGPFTTSIAAPTTADKFLHLTGTVNDFMFITGCTISFRAGYTLRP